jgi:hypothetical protein
MLPGLFFLKRFIIAYIYLVEPGSTMNAFAFTTILFVAVVYASFVWGNTIYQSKTLQWTAVSYEFFYVFCLVMMPVYSDYEQRSSKKEIVSHGFVFFVIFLIYINIMSFFYLFIIGPKRFKIEC